MKGGFYTHCRQMAITMCSTLIMIANKKCNLPFGLQYQNDYVVAGAPATKLRPAIPRKSGHLGPTTFFAFNHNGVGLTTRSCRRHACRSKQSLCPMPSTLHTDLCSTHKRHGNRSQATLLALEQIIECSPTDPLRPLGMPWAPRQASHG